MEHDPAAGALRAPRGALPTGALGAPVLRRAGAFTAGRGVFAGLRRMKAPTGRSHRHFALMGITGGGVGKRTDRRGKCLCRRLVRARPGGPVAVPRDRVLTDVWHIRGRAVPPGRGPGREPVKAQAKWGRSVEVIYGAFAALDNFCGKAIFEPSEDKLRKSSCQLGTRLV